MKAALRSSMVPVGVALLLGLAALGAVAPKAVMAGWLIAFVTLASISFGAVAWLLIHALTGGGWGLLGQAALRRAAAGAPLLLVAFVILLIGAGALYPWRSTPATAGPGVAGAYLNLGFFAARGLIVIAGVTGVGLLIQRPVSALTAGLGLVGYCIGMDLVAVDWLLSLDPRYTSSAFGAQIIIQQLIAALAWTILTTPCTADRRWRDLAALLLATVLGETYLILMTFIIHWYGDQPQQALWYLQRSTGGWAVLEGVGVAIGAIGPLVALLFTRIRTSPSALKRVAAAALFGTFLETIWLVAPVAGVWSALTGVLGTAALAACIAGFGDQVRRLEERPSHGV